MELSEITKLAELPTTLGVVVVFLWFLYKKNGKTEKVLDKVSDSLDRNTRVLARHLIDNKGNEKDIDSLINGKNE